GKTTGASLRAGAEGNRARQAGLPQRAQERGGVPDQAGGHAGGKALDEAGNGMSTELETRTERTEVVNGAPAPETHPLPELEIKPPGRFSGVGLREIWAYRELLYFLTKRELQIRYKQSYLGFGWAILQPVALAFIFALFFGRLAGLSSEGIPYPV